MALINYLNKVHFGTGVLEQVLASECATLGLKRPMLVTDKGVVAAGLADKVLANLGDDLQPVVFDETPENPTEASCRAAVEIYRDAGCDGLVGLGGGSAMDLAKAVGLMATHDGPLASYMAIEGGVGRIRNVLPPLIAIPTTAGTGSEVGRGTLIVLDDNRKLGALSPFLVPKVAICDPLLTVSMPAFLTAATGMDAITHCVETYISKALNPVADGIALEGLRRGFANIRRATEQGSDIEARQDMMAAAMNGALAFQKGLGGVHAMSHALGGLSGLKLHHGALNAILLPHMLRFNAAEVGDRYGALNLAMGLPEGADTAQVLAELVADLNLPGRLSEMGVSMAHVEAAAPLAEKDHTNHTNPRQATAQDYLGLMRDAL